MVRTVRFAVLSLLLLLVACTGGPQPLIGRAADPVYTREACEAARRALLSQGYVVTRAETRLVQGAKRFQPEGEVHVEISFHIVCAGEGERTATLFVSAQQDRYVLKKNPTAATVGVSALGSISMPVGSTEDSLVKVASETIPAGRFYDRFFTLVQQTWRQERTAP